MYYLRIHSRQTKVCGCRLIQGGPSGPFPGTQTFNQQINYMMNEEARKIFSQLLDANFEYAQMDEAREAGESVDIIKMWDIGLHVSNLTKQFREAMGDYEYNEFMRQGRQMFAPAK